MQDKGFKIFLYWMSYVIAQLIVHCVYFWLLKTEWFNQLTSVPYSWMLPYFIPAMLFSIPIYRFISKKMFQEENNNEAVSRAGDD